MKKPLILVDGSSYIYRAFHAMPALTNSQGFPTGAIYGVANMLNRLLADYQPEYMVVVFDAKGKTFRDDLYPLYKANRKEMPEELVKQIEPIKKIVRALGFPLIEIEGVEADDVIGTLVEKFSSKECPILISTGDKDLGQLINKHTCLINTMTDVLLDTDSFQKKMSIAPSQMIDYLALMGDTVDNIPGVPSVGPKTAVKWLSEYGSLDNIMAHADDISGKIGEKLREFLPQLPLSKKLATIKLDVPLQIGMADLQYQAPDVDSLKHLYQEFEFKKWLGALLEKDSTPLAPTNENYKNYETVLTEKQLDQWIEDIQKTKIVAMDTETTSLNYMEALIVGLSFAIESGKAAYIPLAHDYPGAPTQLDRDDTLKKLKSIYEDKKIKKIGHHIKYDLEVLANHGIALQGVAFDTLVESAVLDSSVIRRDMDSLALKYLNWKTISFEEVAGKGAKQVTFNQVPIESAAVYAAEDADVTLALHQTFWPLLEKEPTLQSVFETIEMPLIPVLARMEREGVLIDASQLEKQSAELEKRLMELDEEITGLAGQTFNLNSPKQLQEILFGKLNLPVLKKTPLGQASTADDVLQILALDYPLPKLIIEYRGLAKLLTTYTKKLPTQINLQTGRIHTSYHQMGAATGRLSSSDPNLQNIPVRTEEGRRIRQAFIAPIGYKIVTADYSQIELRIMAHFSEDENLIKAFKHNLDVHQATASEVFHIPLDQVSADERRRAKAINFGLIYGMSAFGLSKQLSISRAVAQQYIDEYFLRYQGVKTYMEKSCESAHQKGYVETLWGRRLYLPEIHSSNMQRRQAAERAAINAPLQGTAADLIKKAMISIDAWLQSNTIDAKMIMQVHDELVFEVKANEVDSFIKVIQSHMVDAAALLVPLQVSIGVGDNWDSASAH